MIKKIIHIADLHIRTFQLHDVYKKQFEIFLNEIKEKVNDCSYNEIRVVIAGDLAHQKINISNEQMMLTSWFIKEIADTIGRVIIIPGNHDFLENNTQRLDSITPIVELLNHNEIRYFKKTGLYDDENVKWVTYSLYDHNVRPDFENNKDGYYVGLFHGPIQGFSTDLGFTFDDAYDKINFLGCDIVLCGDIHKRAIVYLESETKKIPIIQCGSMIQQNFGETIKHHGYGVLNVTTKKYDFFDLPNDSPYMHFRITDVKDIEDEREELLNIG